MIEYTGSNFQIYNDNMQLGRTQNLCPRTHLHVYIFFSARRLLSIYDRQ